VRRAAVFASNSTEPRVIKRFRAFQRAAVVPLGFCFRRQRFNTDYAPFWENTALGEVKDGRYWHRLGMMLRAAWRIFRRRKSLRGVSIFYAINLDMGLLAWAARRIARADAVLLYEVGDIPPVFLSGSLRGRIVRLAERWLLRRADWLVVTSPAFVEEYFRPTQGFDGRSFLLENKLSLSDLHEAKSVSGRKDDRGTERGAPWRIGWFGALRCVRSWEIIKTLAAQLPESVEFHLWGYPSLIDREDFERGVARHANIHYGGEYQAPQDLPALYGSVDLAWGFEFVAERHNSRWLLPNRLYEAGAFGVPLLAARDYEVGKVVEELGIGWTFPEPLLRHLATFLETLDEADYRVVAHRYAGIPMERFASDDDFSALCARALRAPSGTDAIR